MLAFFFLFFFAFVTFCSCKRADTLSSRVSNVAHPDRKCNSPVIRQYMQSLYQSVLPARGEIKNKKKTNIITAVLCYPSTWAEILPNLAAVPFIAGRAHAATLPAATNMGFFPHYGGWWWGGGRAGRRKDRQAVSRRRRCEEKMKKKQMLPSR